MFSHPPVQGPLPPGKKLIREVGVGMEGWEIGGTSEGRRPHDNVSRNGDGEFLN
jgi:hypothetical protein